MTTCPFTETAEKIAASAGLLSASMLHHVSRWHLSLGVLGAAAVAQRDALTSPSERERRNGVTGALRTIASNAAAILFDYGVEDPASAFIAEYGRAAKKHPGMTLDADCHTDESRYYALAEEVGEVAASLTYDNAEETGHNANTISEVTQVGALALAWLTRYQNGDRA